MVKIRTEREIKLIAESNQIVAETLDLMNEYVKHGVKTSELDHIAENYIIGRGGKPAFKGYQGFPSTLCISIDNEVVHGIPGNTKLKDGQIVSIDCGVYKNGYYGDSARTYAVGEIDTDKQKLMDVTEESLQRGIAAAKAGNYVSDIGYAVQSYVEANGFSVVRDLVGHGIGTELHEEPQVPNYGKPKQGHQLQAGMCIAIEPMINAGKKGVFTDSDGWTVKTKDGSASAHFEHTIAITKNGAQILSRSN